MALLEIDALTTGYGTGRKRHAVGERLTAQLRRGEMAVLVGRNGCGKTTLLRTLMGFVPPLSGSVRWDGHDIRTLPPRRLARMVSIVLTARPDTGYLTAREVVESGRMPHTGMTGRLAEADHAAVERALEATEATALAGRRFATLSDGERQRIMTARALAQDTPAILLDEPTAFLDYPSKLSLLRLVRRLAHEAGRAILLSTHNLGPALREADRVWLLRRDGLTCAEAADPALRAALRADFQAGGGADDGDCGSSLYI